MRLLAVFGQRVQTFGSFRLFSAREFRLFVVFCRFRPFSARGFRLFVVSGRFRPEGSDFSSFSAVFGQRVHMFRRFGPFFR